MQTDSLPIDIADAESKLHRARQAASEFAEFDHDSVMKIVRAVADTARNNAQRFGEAAALETGFGVAADKVTKNRSIVDLFLERHGQKNFCAPRFDTADKLIRIPRSAGVIFALTPSTSPVAALYFKILSALLTRSTVLVSPHPAALKVSVEAAHALADAASAAGAPVGTVQILERPSVPLVNAVMAHPITSLILATGGGAMVRAAYQSGTPALGVGPGNPPLIVDHTADLEQAARDIVTSKAFDNSVLCTAESVLFPVSSIAHDLQRHLEIQNAHFCNPDETRRIRDYVYPGGTFNTEVVGRSAVDIARAAQVYVSPDTRLLITPIDRIVDDESLTHEKLSPILAWHVVADTDQAIMQSRELVRIVGTGHSAVIHSNDPATVLAASTTIPVHRISVNCPGSLGNAGIGTTLAPTMSVGTGFAGGSSSGDNLEPDHLVQWTKVAYSSDPSTPFPDFTRAAAELRAKKAQPASEHALTRDDIRRLVLEELRTLMEQAR